MNLRTAVQTTTPPSLVIPPVIAALLMLGPALRPGEVFNLDLVLVRRLEVPAGFWGLGPELPRRLPLWTAISALSRWVPAEVSGKVLMLAGLVAAWVGMARLIRSGGLLAAHVAGALYALSPFVLTRTAVGHFMVTVPHAALPWVLAVLLRPGRHPARTFVAASALAFGGHFGGSVALVVVVVALIAGDRIRWVRGFLVVVGAQLVWLVPGILVLWSGTATPAGGLAFHTVAAGPAGLARLSAGGGFWNTYFQAGGAGWVESAVGVILLALGIAGTRDLPAHLRRPLAILGAIGWMIPAATAVPGVRAVVDAMTANPIGGIWREGHRLLGLHLLWLAPAAVLGARRLAMSARCPDALVGAVRVAPLACCVVLAVPSVWGIGGQLEATPVPSEWAAARRIVANEPGTVLALPWFQYFNLSVGDGHVHRVLNPLPLYLGGDVLASSNSGLGSGLQESADPREPGAGGLVARLERGEAISAGLVALGVRWIVLLKALDAHPYSALRLDPGLSAVADGATLAVFDVVGTRGRGMRADGGRVTITESLPSLVHADTENAFTWFRPGSRGWRRSGRAATVDGRGLLAVPPGTGAVWNVALIPCIISQLLTPLAFVVFMLDRRRRRARPV